MNRFKIKIAALFILASLLSLQSFAYGWPWTKDMWDQPSIKPGELLLPLPPGTLPVNGGELPMDRFVAGQKLKNPVPSTPESQGRGEKLYNIYCHICHGPGAKGDGPIAASLDSPADRTKFLRPPDLTIDFFKNKTDGFVYGTIANGGFIMPPYGGDVTPAERWDLINYLRRLQDK